MDGIRQESGRRPGGNLVVKCLICDRKWTLESERYFVDEQPPYEPQPTKLGICTCPKCHFFCGPKHSPRDPFAAQVYRQRVGHKGAT